MRRITGVDMKNNFIIELGRASNGWCGIGLFNNAKLLIGISGTGVYNPFCELPELVKSIKDNKEYVWEIDQEGYDAEITFIPNKDEITIKTKELKDTQEFEDTENIYNTEQVLGEIYEKFTDWEKNNQDALNDFHYSFYFNIRAVQSIIKKGYYEDEILKRHFLTYEDEVIFEEFDTKEDIVRYVLEKDGEMISRDESLKETYGKMETLNDKLSGLDIDRNGFDEFHDNIGKNINFANDSHEWDMFYTLI